MFQLFQLLEQLRFPPRLPLRTGLAFQHLDLVKQFRAAVVLHNLFGNAAPLGGGNGSDRGDNFIPYGIEIQSQAEGRFRIGEDHPQEGPLRGPRREDVLQGDRGRLQPPSQEDWHIPEVGKDGLTRRRHPVPGREDRGPASRRDRRDSRRCVSRVRIQMIYGQSGDALP